MVQLTIGWLRRGIAFERMRHEVDLESAENDEHRSQVHAKTEARAELSQGARAAFGKHLGLVHRNQVWAQVAASGRLVQQRHVGQQRMAPVRGNGYADKVNALLAQHHLGARELFLVRIITIPALGFDFDCGSCTKAPGNHEVRRVKAGGLTAHPVAPARVGLLFGAMEKFALRHVHREWLRLKTAYAGVQSQKLRDEALRWALDGDVAMRFGRVGEMGSAAVGWRYLADANVFLSKAWTRAVFGGRHGRFLRVFVK